MIRDIIKYPTPPSVEYSTDIRVFDTNLYLLIDDLKDTINANNLQGLAAYQIGNQHNVVVIKQGDNIFLELINPRILSHKGTTITEEQTAYFPGLSAKVKRFESILVIYQDRFGKDCSLHADGQLAILLQRKIDYTFGSSFINKLDKQERKRFDKKLQFGSNIAIPESCPVFSLKDKINQFIKIIFVAMFLILTAMVFVPKDMEDQLFLYHSILGGIVFLFSIFSLFLGYFEGKRYRSCTSCQIGNLLGIIATQWIKLTILMVISYLLNL